MKKLLLLATLISTAALADNPFPESCEKFIATPEEAFAIIAKEDPSKAEEIEKMQQAFAEIREEWRKIQALDADNLRKAGKEIVTEVCEKGLESIEASIKQYKQ